MLAPDTQGTSLTWVGQWGSLPGPVEVVTKCAVLSVTLGSGAFHDWASLPALHLMDFINLPICKMGIVCRSYQRVRGSNERSP